MNPQSSIQIYGRIRPLQKNPKIQNTSGRYWINEEIDGTPHVGFHVPKDELQGLINHKKENYEFKFNKIFDVDSEQEEVFDIVAKPVVERYF
jgi:kinesin family protein 6/9